VHWVPAPRRQTCDTFHTASGVLRGVDHTYSIRVHVHVRVDVDCLSLSLFAEVGVDRMSMSR
jgi:murein endopeptidase